MESVKISNQHFAVLVPWKSIAKGGKRRKPVQLPMFGIALLGCLTNNFLTLTFRKRNFYPGILKLSEQFTALNPAQKCNSLFFSISIEVLAATLFLFLPACSREKKFI